MESIVSKISVLHLNTLLILGLALFGGTIGGRLFQKMKIPQVVGYIMMGFILGDSITGIINAQMLDELQPLNYLALGLIGLMIGAELKKDVITKYGRQFLTILLFEGTVTMLCVTLFIGIAGTFLLEDAPLAWGLGLILGAIASATAPAATTDVLWETKSKGHLTTMVFGIVALDDVLAITFFAVATSLATEIFGMSHESVLISLLHPAYEIGGAVLLGAVSGLALIWILKHYSQKERVLVFLIGTVLLVLGTASAINVNMILAAMILGAMIVNGLPHLSRQTFEVLEGFTPPIFTLFFVFIGAKVELGSINSTFLALILIYIFGRTLGKMSGAYLGASLSGAHASVKRYLPFCLFSQAGVAVGLSIVAAQTLPQELSGMIIIIITASTFIVQLIGPLSVKFAVTKAKETGRNITEEDLIRMYRVKDIIDERYPVIKENVPLKEILHIFGTSPYTQYPVVDMTGRLSGVINIDCIKNSLLLEDSSQLLLAADIKDGFNHTINAQETLLNAKIYMDRARLGFLPVVDTTSIILGCFDRRMYQRFISSKLLELQKD